MAGHVARERSERSGIRVASVAAERAPSVGMRRVKMCTTLRCAQARISAAAGAGSAAASGK